MSITYQTLIETLGNHPNKKVRFVLPDNKEVPMHYHITDVGAVMRYFIDCGGQQREDHYVHIQLWLGADTEHRLTTDRIQQILAQSQMTLERLDKFEQYPVMFEYQTEMIATYSVQEIIETKDTEDDIVVKLAPQYTKCLAAIRHQQEIDHKTESSCCSNQRCCG